MNMNSGFLMTMTTIATFGLGLLILTSEPSEWVPSLSDFGMAKEPILVVIVGSDSGVEQVRAAISNDRIVAEGEGAFALRDMRIVASSPEAASGPINEMGWIDREIELVAVPMARGLKWERNRGKTRGAQSDESRGSSEDSAQAERIAELVKKPTLTTGEAMAVLSHMDKTGQF